MAEISVRSIARALDSVRPANRFKGSAEDERRPWFDANPDTARLYEAMLSTATDPIGLVGNASKGLSQLHRWTPEQRRAGRHRSLRAMVDRHRAGTSARLLVYNTWLIDPPLGVKQPLDREARIGELGRSLNAISPDIVALSEVFGTSERDGIEAELSFDFESRAGPLGEPPRIGSGLLAIVRHPEFPIVSVETMVYRHNGGFWDNMARKGVLYLEINLGPGHIDLFVTHMDAANREPDGFSEVRRRQTIELGRFIEENRKPENVVLVVGDLNVDARHNEYIRLVHMLYHRTRGDIVVEVTNSASRIGPGVVLPFDFELRLQDLWISRGSPFGATSKIEEFETICAVDGEGYCEDYRTNGVPGGDASKSDREPGYRLDYIFLEEPRDSHKFNLDVSRVRRRPFWRGDPYHKNTFTTHSPRRMADDLLDDLMDPTVTLSSPEARVPNFLSDHLGLEVMLFASPLGAG